MSRGRVVRIIIAVPLVLLVLAGLFFFYYYQSHEISYDQTLSAAVRDNVHIRRASNGVPFIQATDRRDALLALGFVQAQDRLPQMEYLRALVHGSLPPDGRNAPEAVVLFAEALQAFTRAEQIIPELSEEELELLQSFVAGINLYREKNDYVGTGFGLDARVWEPADIIAVFILVETTRAYLETPEIQCMIPQDRIPQGLDEFVPAGLVRAYSKDQKSLIRQVRQLRSQLRTTIPAYGRGFSVIVQAGHQSKMLTQIDSSGPVFPLVYPCLISVRGERLAGNALAGTPFFLHAKTGSLSYSIFSAGIDSVDIVPVVFEKDPYTGETVFACDGQRIRPDDEEMIRRCGVLLEQSGREQQGERLLLRFVFPDARTFSGLLAPAAGTLTTQNAREILGSLNIAPVILVMTDGTYRYSAFCGKSAPNGAVNNRVFAVPGHVRTEIVVPLQPLPDAERYTIAGNDVGVERPALGAMIMPLDRERDKNLRHVLEQTGEFTRDYFPVLEDTRDGIASQWSDYVSSLLELMPVTSAKLCRFYLADWKGEIRGKEVAPVILESLRMRLFHDVLADHLGNSFYELSRVRYYCDRKLLEALERNTSPLFDNQSTPERVEDADAVFDASFFYVMRQLHRSYGPRMENWCWRSFWKLTYRIPGVNSSIYTQISKAADGSGSTVRCYRVAHDYNSDSLAYGQVTVASMVFEEEFRQNIYFGISQHPLSTFYAPFPREKSPVSVDRSLGEAVTTIRPL